MPKTRKDKPRKRRPTKDKVLQARIPEELDDQLRGRAEKLGLSVSTVVRNVLFNTFNLVEGVVADSAQLARVFTENAENDTHSSNPAEPADSAAIVGWQEVVLNLNGICDECNAILQKGQLAAVGVPTAIRPVVLCLDCLAALSDDNAPETSS